MFLLLYHLLNRLARKISSMSISPANIGKVSFSIQPQIRLQDLTVCGRSTVLKQTLYLDGITSVRILKIVWGYLLKHSKKDSLMIRDFKPVSKIRDLKREPKEYQDEMRQRLQLYSGKFLCI